MRREERLELLDEDLRQRYLARTHAEGEDPMLFPAFEAIQAVRQARAKAEVTRKEYQQMLCRRRDLGYKGDL